MGREESEGKEEGTEIGRVFWKVEADYITARFEDGVDYLGTYCSYASCHCWLLARWVGVDGCGV